MVWKRISVIGAKSILTVNGSNRRERASRHDLNYSYLKCDRGSVLVCCDKLVRWMHTTGPIKGDCICFIFNIEKNPSVLFYLFSALAYRTAAA